MDLGRRVLAKAIEKVGLEAVAAHLGMRPALLSLYVDGQRTVPESMLLKLVDLVLDDETRRP
jgi:hypothetical protein